VQYPKDEDPKAAQITLKNAVRKSSQDPAIHRRESQSFISSSMMSAHLSARPAPPATRVII
jgi:hypothetical protein